MLKTPLAAVAAAILAFVAFAVPVSANSHCRTHGAGSCVEAHQRATIGRVSTVYRTVYVQQVRNVVRVRNVYRDRVVHARPAPQPVMAHSTFRYRVAHRGWNHGAVQHGPNQHGPNQHGMRHPNWIATGVTHCRCDGYGHAGYHYPGDYRGYR